MSLAAGQFVCSSRAGLIAAISSEKRRGLRDDRSRHHQPCNTGGYDFWLNVLSHGDQSNVRGMVCSFITAAEYQLRFDPVITQTNRDCSQ
jgi:hypothetical protein